MRNIKEKNRLNFESGITLVALIITIIVLIILAAVSINTVFKANFVGMATNGTINYAEAQSKEIKEFDDLNNYLEVAINKKPHIESVRYSDRTENTMKITTKAIDGDGEILTYKLYIGTSIEDIIEQTEIKEEQGKEVEWIVPVKDKNTVYYYKIEVKDRFVTVESEIKETNNAPVLESLEIAKTINNITVSAKGIDADGDNIKYTMYIWKLGQDGEDEITTIEDKLGKTEKDVTFEELRPYLMQTLTERGKTGEIVELNTKTTLSEYTNYYYRIDVQDEKENDITVGEIKRERTYCSGTGTECNGIICPFCEGTGTHSVDGSQIIFHDVHSYTSSPIADCPTRDS